jgi:hypothetical protein
MSRTIEKTAVIRTRNQPQAQDFVLRRMKLFVHTERIAGTGKQSLINYNWRCEYANGLVVLVEGTLELIFTTLSR